MIANFGGELAALTAAFLWAWATLIYSRVGKIIPPLEMNLIKGILAVSMLSLTLILRGSAFSAIEPLALGLLLLSGAVGIALGDTAYFESLKWLGARRTLLVGILGPPLTGIVALIFLGEELNLAAWSGIGLTMLGVAWVVTERIPDPLGEPDHLGRGLAFGLLAALAQAVGVVLSRAALVQTDVSPLWSSLLRLAGGILILLVFLPLNRRPIGRWLKFEQSQKLWGTLVFATFAGTYLGIWLVQVSLKLTDAGIAQTLFATSQLFVLPMAAVRGEKISFRAIAGACVALAGVGLLFAFK